MTPDLLEHQVRRLPHVVAVSIDEHQVTVLLQPSGDADGTSVLVAALLATSGLERSIRVLGGSSGAALRPRRTAPVLAGTAAGVGMLSMVAAAAAMQGILPMPVLDPTPDAPRFTVAEPAITPAPRSGHRAIVPGRQPRWAAGEGSIPLPPAPAEVEVPGEQIDAAVTAALLAGAGPSRVEPVAPPEGPPRRVVRRRRAPGRTPAPVALPPAPSVTPPPVAEVLEPAPAAPVEPVVVVIPPAPVVVGEIVAPVLDPPYLLELPADPEPTAPYAPPKIPEQPEQRRTDRPEVEREPTGGDRGRGREGARGRGHEHGLGHDKARGAGHDGEGRGHAGRDG